VFSASWTCRRIFLEFVDGFIEASGRQPPSLLELRVKFLEGDDFLIEWPNSGRLQRLFGNFERTGFT